MLMLNRINGFGVSGQATVEPPDVDPPEWPQFVQDILDDEPVAYWRMQETVQDEDLEDAVSNHDAHNIDAGTVDYGEAWPGDLAGTALRFHGDGAFTFNLSSFDELAIDGFTIEALFTWAGAGAEDYIFSYGGNPEDSGIALFIDADGFLSFRIGNDTDEYLITADVACVPDVPYIAFAFRPPSGSPATLELNGTTVGALESSPDPVFPENSIGVIGGTIAPVVDSDDFQAVLNYSGLLRDVAIYNYRLGSDRREVHSENSLVGGLPGGGDPPAAPENLIGTPADSEADFTWDAVDDADSYNLYGSVDEGGPYSLIEDGILVTSAAFVGAPNDVELFYVVTATGPGGESGYSNEVSVIPSAGPPPAPDAPTGVDASSSDDSAYISWDAVDGADTYTLKISTVMGGPYTPLHTLITPLHNLATGLTLGVPYYFVVSATNVSGEGPDSSEVTVTPSASSGWTAAAAPAPSGTFGAFYSSSAARFVAYGNVGLGLSQNGYAFIDGIDLSPYLTSPFSSSIFSGAANGSTWVFACKDGSDGRLVRTDDSGATFASVEFLTGEYFTSVAYASFISTWFALGHHGHLYASTDDGATWSLVKTFASIVGSGIGLTSFIVASASTVCVGISGQTSGTGYATSTNGTAWTDRTFPTTNTSAAQNSAHYNPTIGKLFLGSDGVYSSIDGTGGWAQTNPGGLGAQYSASALVDEKSFFAGRGPASSYVPYVVETDDGSAYTTNGINPPFSDGLATIPTGLAWDGVDRVICCQNLAAASAYMVVPP